MLKYHMMLASVVGMGPILLCDKSAIQTLQKTAPQLVHHYFWLNIPPVLVTEVLGDLAKKSSNEEAKQDVQLLAKKLGHPSAIPNVNCRDLINTELGGTKIEMHRCPIVAEGARGVTPDGDIVTHIADDPCELALLRWRSGDFSEDEALFSAAWRNYKNGIHWKETITKLGRCYSHSMKPKRNLSDALDFVDDLLASAEPDYLLSWLLEDLLFPTKIIAEIAHFFKGASPSALNKVPYTRYCLRASLFAHFSMAFNLVSQKADNRIDLEYLLYLPFCGAFSSQDRFHKSLAPYLLEKDQVFVPYDELASGLRSIMIYLDGLPLEERQKELRKVGPPEIESSIVHQLWQRFMIPGYRTRSKLQLTKEQEVKLVERAMALMAAPLSEGGALNGPISAANDDTVIRTRWIYRNDPCPCRSGKTYKDCHGLPETNTDAK